eukprot:GEZU01027495.1.p1 GENE.GEZU01027495.1~~GEZU01027495.1.p1  ORF type:complete len:129 (-),score=18.80 GEZU01027495.1:685-1035(-)
MDGWMDGGRRCGALYRIIKHDVVKQQQQQPVNPAMGDQLAHKAPAKSSDVQLLFDSYTYEQMIKRGVVVIDLVNFENDPCQIRKLWPISNLYKNAIKRMWTLSQPRAAAEQAPPSP